MASQHSSHDTCPRHVILDHLDVILERRHVTAAS
jgi:hypothetical protein